MPDHEWTSAADLATQEGSLCLGTDCEVGKKKFPSLAQGLFLIQAPQYQTPVHLWSNRAAGHLDRTTESKDIEFQQTQPLFVCVYNESRVI